MRFFLITLCLLGFAGLLQAQKLSDWQYLQEDNVTKLNPPHFETNLKEVSSRNGSERLPVVYEYASIPAKNDPKWKIAPISGGKVNYSVKSRLSNTNYNIFTKEIDITYFRAFLDLRGFTTINNATVTIGNVDDQARMLIYNSKNDATYVPAKDAMRGGREVIVDFTKYVVPNEINTFVIVQIDDNCCGNNLTGGLTVKLNNTVLTPNPEVLKDLSITTGPDYSPEIPVDIPMPVFNVNAFSVNQGQGRGLWFFGINDGDKTGRIIQKGTEKTTVLRINKIIVNNTDKVYAFKVTNYPNCPGKSAYLQANNNGTVTIECVDDSKGVQSLSNNVQFKSISAFTKELGDGATFSSFESKLRNTDGQKLYLRHSGYVLYVNPEHPSELFRQDASWKIVPPTN